MTITVQDWMVEDAQRLAECRHDHPLSILGPQSQDNGGWVIRVWMPEANNVTLLSGSEEIRHGNSTPSLDLRNRGQSRPWEYLQGARESWRDDP